MLSLCWASFFSVAKIRLYRVCSNSDKTKVKRSWVLFTPHGIRIWFLHSNFSRLHHINLSSRECLANGLPTACTVKVVCLQNHIGYNSTPPTSAASNSHQNFRISDILSLPYIPYIRFCNSSFLSNLEFAQSRGLINHYWSVLLTE